MLTARSPGDLLAVVPYRVGFHPTESLVVLTVTGDRKQLGFSLRVDLPAVEHTLAVADQVSAALEQNGAETVLLVAYSVHAERAQPLVDEMLRRFTADHIEVLEALRADGERWFSYTCGGACCPPDGTAYDNSCHLLTAQAVMAGEVALPDRGALEASVAPITGDAASSMKQHAAAVEDDLVASLAAGEASSEVRDSLQARMRDFVGAYVAAPRPLTDVEAAQLAVWAQFLPVRDVAWTAMTRAEADVHLDLWHQVLRRVTPPYEPAVACLTAFAAWLKGDGALAGCAVDRALAADPDYSMAALIDDTLRNAVPPSSWDVIAEELTRLAG